MLSGDFCRKFRSGKHGIVIRTAFQNCRTPCGKERIPASDRIHNFARKDRIIRKTPSIEQPAALRTERQNDTSQRKALRKSSHDSTVISGDPEYFRNGSEFIFVDFQDIGKFQRRADHLSIIKILTQIDIENFQSVIRNLFQQFADRFPRPRILADSYPDKEKMQSLLLIDAENGNQLLLGKFRQNTPPGTIGEIRCDLHPRWNPAGDIVTIDSIDSGRRAIYLLDLHEAFAELEGR